MDRLKEIDKKLIPLRRVHANYFPSFDRFLLIDSIRGSNAKNTFRLPPPSSYFDRSTKESTERIAYSWRNAASKECLIIDANWVESRVEQLFQATGFDRRTVVLSPRERTIHFPAG